MEQFHSYRPAEGHGLKHNPLPTIIGPRPIAWISSKSPRGILNLAPYSFFNLFNYTPPIIAFSSVGYKDSIRNIEASKEFVCNIVDHAVAEKMNASSAPLAYEVSEFEYAELQATPSDMVAAPRVREAKIALECQLSQIIQLKDAKENCLDTWMILAEVVLVHIDKQIINNAELDKSKFKQILRGGGVNDYYEVGLENVFYMSRPTLSK
ncbi:flavin reductase family protein [Comamonas kerstersii]|uniref:flavin reductase family protein n=1 Tax=Comamonas kerstersii TaxID=225992 RepID=UPI003A928722